MFKYLSKDNRRPPGRWLHERGGSGTSRIAMGHFNMACTGPTTGSLNFLQDAKVGSPHASSLVEEAPLKFNGVSFGYFAYRQLPQARPSFTCIYSRRAEKKCTSIYFSTHSAISVLLRGTSVSTPTYQDGFGTSQHVGLL